MAGDATVYIERRDYVNRPHPRIEQGFLANGKPVSISCDFICPSHSDFKEVKSFLHPSPPFARIFAMERGEAKIETDSEAKTLKQGRIYLLPPEQPFKASYMKCKIKGFHIQLSDGLGFPIGASLRGIPEIRDERLFEAIIDAVASEIDALWQAAAYQAALRFCLPLLPELEARANPSPSHRLVLEALAKEAPGSLRVDKLAKRLRVSPAALSKSFQRHFGLPLKSHIVATAMVRAKELLLRTELRASEIAFELGYKEPCYFNRLFKREVGLTPLAYRRRGAGQTP